MMSSWMMYLFVVGSLLGAAAWWLDRLCRLSHKPTRWVWAGALLFTVVLAGVARGAAGRENATGGGLDARAVSGTDGAIPSARPAGWTIATLRHVRSSIAAALGPARHWLVAPLQRVLAFARRNAPAAAERWLAAAWAVSSGAVLLLFIVVYGTYRRTRCRWPTARVQGMRVRLAPRAGPAVMGLVHPEIVLPEWLLQRTEEEQRLALAHETEHVRARDPLLLAAGCVAAALFPWHPVVWWMCARLRLAVELDCDARVLQGGVAARRYGTVLVELASRCAGLRIASPALTDSSSHLERRLLAMAHHRPRFAAVRGAAFAACALAALLVACDADLPTATEVNQMDVAGAERAMVRTHASFMADSNATYTVDGVPASYDEAHALAPGEIARVHLQGNASADYAPEMRVDIITVAAAGTLRDDGAAASEKSRVMLRRSASAGAAGTRVSGGVNGAYRVEGTATFGAEDRTNGLSTLSTRLRDYHSGDTVTVKLQGGVRLSTGARLDGTQPSAIRLKERPLIYIDGVLQEDASGSAGPLSRLSPENIQSIEVIKGPAASAVSSDPRAANGIIRITTKSGS